MTLSMPAYLEVERDLFKALEKCDYSDVVVARKRETDPERRAQINELLRFNRKVWLEFPNMTVGDITS